MDRENLIEEKLSVFRFTNYRELLRQFYDTEKRLNKSYSYRVFARRAKLGSPNYLKLVIDGQRRITDKNLPNFIRGLRLDQEEAAYFRLLVRCQEAKDEDAKQEYLDRLSELRKQYRHELSLLDHDRFEILGSWHYWAVRELVLLDNFDDDPEWISERLQSLITPSEAKKAIHLLLQLRFIEKIGEKYFQHEPLLDTGDELSIRRLKELHQQFTELSIRSIFEDRSDRRSINGLTIALGTNRVQDFRKDLMNFRNEMNRKYSRNSGNEELYHLVMNFFPLSKEEVPQ